MSPTGIKLFAVTETDQLCYRDLSGTGDWKAINRIPDVIAMSAVEDVLFFCLNRKYGSHTGMLAARFAAAENLVEGAIDQASNIIAVAAVKGSIHVLSNSLQLYKRPAVFEDVAWTSIGNPSQVLKGKTIYAMTEVSGKLIAAADDNRLYEWVPSSNEWKRQDGYSNNAVVLAGYAGVLYAVNTSNQLIAKNPSGDWTKLAESEPLKGMTAAQLVDFTTLTLPEELERTGTDG